jgi:small conductance mechanosensitive channel
VLKDPVPIVRLADSAVQIAVKPWVAVADYEIAVGELGFAIVEACRERGISIPYLQREVRLIAATGASGAG